MNPMETIGDRVKRLRKAKGVERKDLARDSGLSYTMVSDLESGKARSTTKLHRIAAVLGVDVRYLETGKGVQDAPDSQYSQPVRLDAKMIAETHRVLRELEHDEGRQYSIEETPELFVEVYAMRASMPVEPSQDQWVQFGRKLATIMSPQGASTDERDDHLPAKSAGTGKMAGKIHTKT